MPESGSGPTASDGPTTLIAYPGPTSGSVTLARTSLPNATGYAIYWSTSPGVTPANGTRVAAVQPEAGRAAGPNYYIVTALTPSGERAPSAEAQVTLIEGLSFTILRLGPTTLVGDTLHLEVSITSRYEIRSAIATVEGRQAKQSSPR